MEIALIVSIALNVLFIALLFLQHVKYTITARAMAELVERVTKLEEIARRPPEKIAIVPQQTRRPDNEKQGIA